MKSQRNKQKRSHILAYSIEDVQSLTKSMHGIEITVVTTSKWGEYVVHDTKRNVSFLPLFFIYVYQ